MVWMVRVVEGEDKRLALEPIGDLEYNQGRNLVSIYLFDPWVNMVLVQQATLYHPKLNLRRIYCGTLCVGAGSAWKKRLPPEYHVPTYIKRINERSIHIL